MPGEIARFTQSLPRACRKNRLCAAGVFMRPAPKLLPQTRRKGEYGFFLRAIGIPLAFLRSSRQRGKNFRKRVLI